MSFNFTNEQKAIFEEIVNPTSPILAIEATAGAAKSSSLVEAIKRLKGSNPNANVRYLIFGNLASKEAKLLFGHTAIVSTLHSLAYIYTIKPYGLGNVKPFLTWMDLPKKIKRPFGTDFQITQIIENYCLSKYVSFSEYANSVDEEELPQSLVEPVKSFLNLMAKGSMPVTHSFYLKLFHVMIMNNKIKLPHVDRLLVDEFQDMSGLALDIISKFSATQKVFVGDRSQRIFDFLKLVDGFAHYPDAKKLTLNQSFRVDTKYAPAIETFIKRYLNVEGRFKGAVYPKNPTINSKVYLTRNNSTLIAKMIKLNKNGTPYNLAHTAKLNQIFKLPLAIVYAKMGFKQNDSELKHFQHEIDMYAKVPIAKRSSYSMTKHLLNSYKEDPKMTSAIKLVLQFGNENVINAYTIAKAHKKTKCDLSIMTTFSAKGITRDEVELDDDLNEAIKSYIDIPIEMLTEEQRAEFALYFVACTRHRHKLINARYLDALSDVDSPLVHTNLTIKDQL